MVSVGLCTPPLVSSIFLVGFVDVCCSPLLSCGLLWSLLVSAGLQWSLLGFSISAGLEWCVVGLQCSLVVSVGASRSPKVFEGL